MKWLAFLMMAALAAAPAYGQTGRVHGAWLQTAPTWAVTPDNPWTVMIFNADGSFCVGTKKDARYAIGTYIFDGSRMVTTSTSTGRVTARTVEPGGSGRLVMHDPQLDEPVIMVRTDMFAGCAALKTHQGAQ